jgi:uncharacterized cupin superfamily protein
VAERPAVVRVDAVRAALDPDPLEPDQIVSGDPRTSALVLSRSSDGQEAGIWSCTPGKFTDVEEDETFVVIEGRATIAFDGGEVEVGPGDVCELTAGAETVWTVHETLLKGFRIGPARRTEASSAA